MTRIKIARRERVIIRRQRHAHPSWPSVLQENTMQGTHDTRLSRRHWLAAAALTLPAVSTWANRPEKPLVEMWKSATCGCCGEWAKHLEANGFRVQTTTVDNPSLVRARFGIDHKLGSCHTARVGGYVLEGHVPAKEIQRLLKEKPKDVLGIVVPGMPLGSPGMDSPSYGGKKTPYDVVVVRKDGRTGVYQSYR